MPYRLYEKKMAAGITKLACLVLSRQRPPSESLLLKSSEERQRVGPKLTQIREYRRNIRGILNPKPVNQACAVLIHRGSWQPTASGIEIVWTAELKSRELAIDRLSFY